VEGESESEAWPTNMGCTASTPVDEHTRVLAAQLQEEQKRLAKELKLLLLGAGESGKSTIAKQMKILHLNGFTKAELLAFKPVLNSNAIEIVGVLISGCVELGIAIPPENAALCAKIEGLGSIETRMDQALVAELKAVWGMPAIQECYARRSDLQLPSSADYIMANLDRYAALDFVPSPEDVLRGRARTTGIHELEFDIESMHFRMVDVGGQRSERKKWAHCFEDVTAIIFVVAMDGYDMKLYEDEGVNRMQEARKLFDDIVNSRWFQATTIVLFLNKSDLFAEKIKTVDLKVCFSDYKGGNDYTAAAEFLTHKFKKLNRRTVVHRVLCCVFTMCVVLFGCHRAAIAAQGREIYPHTTCATDTENVKVVFKAVRETLINKSMAHSSMI